MNQKYKILLVEDEQAIRDGLIDLLIYHGYQVQAVADGESGFKEALERNFDLIVLDVMLPKKDGFTLCDEIRKAKPEQLIIMLTAKTSEEDIITGLKSGADDYIAKPFSVRELVLRISAVLRRSKKARIQSRQVELGDLLLDTKTLIARSISQPQHPDVNFTRREVDIILYLLANSDRPVTRGELLDQVWGYERASAIETRTVDIHIAKLRRKFEPDPKNPSILITTRGAGYQLIAKSDTES